MLIYFSFTTVYFDSKNTCKIQGPEGKQLHFLIQFYAL